MSNSHVGRIAFAGVAALILLGSLVATPGTADAQPELYETCAAYRTIVGTGGQIAADAAAQLQVIDDVNPFGLDNVLEVIINGEADVPPIGSRPTADALQVAYRELDGFFNETCVAVDVCPLIRQAIAPNDDLSAESAELAQRLTAPAPAGITVAFSYIAGTLLESPWHDTVAEAQAQIDDWFNCDPPPASPAPDPGVLATCADVSVLSIPEGPRAIAAAERLRARGAPNPPGIERALDVLADNADRVGPELDVEDVDAAYGTIDGYFGETCQNIDLCPLVVQAVGADLDQAAAAALLVWRLDILAPPGIGSGLAWISGEVDSTPFHGSITDAQAQIEDYYSCVTLAFTGPGTAVPLSVLGFGLIGTGASVLIARRRIALHR